MCSLFFCIGNDLLPHTRKRTKHSVQKLFTRRLLFSFLCSTFVVLQLFFLSLFFPCSNSFSFMCVCVRACGEHKVNKAASYVSNEYLWHSFVPLFIFAILQRNDTFTRTYLKVLEIHETISIFIPSLSFCCSLFFGMHFSEFSIKKTSTYLWP